MSHTRRDVVLTALAAPLAARSQPDGGGGRFVDLGMSAPRGALRGRRVSVWLPPAYERGSRCAVLYMHDGQNLFDPTLAYGGVPWAADRVLGDLIRDERVAPTMIVGLWNTPDRWNEYAPQAALEPLPAEVRDRLGGRLGGRAGLLADAYLAYLVEELKPRIDAEFRTHPAPSHTVVMGSSMGGLISLYALVRHPQVFGAAGGLSTHWPIGSLEDRPGLQADIDAATAAHRAWLARELPPPGRHRIYLDHGTEQLDAAYGPLRARADAVFASRGWVNGPQFASRVFAGTGHNEAAWQARLAIPLEFLLPPA